MYAKIITLGLAASLLDINAGNGWLKRVPLDVTKGPALMPQAVGDWQQTTHWLYPPSTAEYPLGMGQFQEYAQYTHDGLLVTLSFDHNRLSPHNAVNCFLDKGESVESSTVRSLRTMDGSARFNLARFDEGGSTSLVAASQCLAQGCIENAPAPSWADLGRPSYWKALLLAPPYSAIPVSISIGRSTEQQAQVSYSAMEQALADFVANLDLNPVRHQAQVESGAEK